MSRQVRVSDETYLRLQMRADGRPLGMAIERLLDAADDQDKSAQRAGAPKEGKTRRAPTRGQPKAERQ